eukprot:scaffold294695_cov19-Tisochrysis_lutea.AAC.3
MAVTIIQKEPASAGLDGCMHKTMNKQWVQENVCLDRRAAERMKKAAVRTSSYCGLGASSGRTQA